MREFNTYGPVNPKRHYHIDRVAVKAAMREKIEKGRYFTLNAGRQTGKTTLFREVIAELEADGRYLGVLLDCNGLSQDPPPLIYEQISTRLQDSLGPRNWPGPLGELARGVVVAHHHDLARFLRELGRLSGRRILVIIDEFDALPEPVLTPLLGTFRYLYHHRDEPEIYAPHSLILVGVRTIPSLLQGTQSPFNIADQFTVPYFTAREVADLLSQHTAETGQPFEPRVIDEVFTETEGQPFLVNRIGQILTQDLVPDRSRAITPSDLEYALALLLSENNTHFASIVSKAAPYRESLLPLLFYDERRSDFMDPMTQELIMYGVLRVVSDERRLRYARIGNPIYRKVLLLRFATPRAEMPISGALLHRYVVEGVLDFDGLMDSFKAFMEEHGVRLMRSQATGRPLEMSGQYLLLSYLSAARSSIGGHVTIESLSSAGEMDVMAFYRGARFIVETKVWYGKAALEKGKAQLVAYLAAAGLHKGYLVVFDENVAQNPIVAESGAVFEVSVDDRRLRIYFIAVQV
jgi:hypothetical protein